MELQEAGRVGLSGVNNMLAQVWRGREWRYALVAALALALAGCGGGEKYKDLLKDSPSQEGPGPDSPTQ